MQYFTSSLALSQFFLENEEYDRARYWLDLAADIKPDETSPIRLNFLVDANSGECQDAKHTLESNRSALEESDNWPILEAIYEKNCLDNPGKWQQLFGADE